MRRVLKSPLFGPIAVGLGNDFHQVPVRVVEIDAAAAVAMVDFAGTLTPRRRVVLDAAGADARQRRIELRLADEEREVLRPKSSRVSKSSVTPLAVRTGAKWPHSGPASRFRISARNFADTHLSLAGMIVWFSSTLISVSCGNRILRSRFQDQKPGQRIDRLILS